DAQGRHVQTRNRQGHVTSFLYDGAGKLQTITLPPAAAALSDTFHYDGNAHVSTIVVPGVPSSRPTTLTISATTGRLTTILDPDSPAGRESGLPRDLGTIEPGVHAARWPPCSEHEVVLPEPLRCS